MTLADPLGVQTPRISWIPPGDTTIGRQAVELAASAGLMLDDWQAFVLSNALAVRPDGKFSAFEVALCVARQNGKSELLIARILAGLFLLRERLIIFSAHQFDTAMEIFDRLVSVVDGCPKMRAEVKLNRGEVGIYSHGREGIKLRNGQRVRFKARSTGGGRGFTGDCVILDEAMVISRIMHGNLMPTMSAMSIEGNPQMWYAGSAVDQVIHEHGEVFARTRERGIKGDANSLMYAEWSADGEITRAAEVADDRDAWAQANPGMGIRISAEHIGLERDSMDPRTFAVERLGIGDWPAVGDGSAVIPLEAWRNLADPASKPNDPVVFAFDVTPDRGWGAIGVAGKRGDGHAHLEIVEHRRGTGWIVGRLAQLTARHQCGPVRCDETGPAGSLVPGLTEIGVQVESVTAREHAQACGLLFDTVEAGGLRHHGQPELEAAIRGASKRGLGEAWAWSRKNSGVDISPLVTATLALWGLHTSAGNEAWTSSW